MNLYVKLRRKPYIHSPEVQLVIDRARLELNKWNFSKLCSNGFCIENAEWYNGWIGLSKHGRIFMRAESYYNCGAFGGQEGTYDLEKFIRVHPGIALHLISYIEDEGQRKEQEKLIEEQMRQNAYQRLIESVKEMS